MSTFKVIKSAGEVQYIKKETTIEMESKFMDSRLFCYKLLIYSKIV